MVEVVARFTTRHSTKRQRPPAGAHQCSTPQGHARPREGFSCCDLGLIPDLPEKRLRCKTAESAVRGLMRFGKSFRDCVNPTNQTRRRVSVSETR